MRGLGPSLSCGEGSGARGQPLGAGASSEEEWIPADAAGVTNRLGPLGSPRLGWKA